MQLNYGIQFSSCPGIPGRVSTDRKKNNYWFRAKRYGWGWGMPATWQGWIALIIYLVLIATCAFFLPPAGRMGLFWGLTILLTLLFILICWIKGEPLGWRWGQDKNSNKGS